MHLHRPEQRIGETMSGIIGGAGSKSGVIGTTELDYEEGTWSPELYIGGTISSVHNYNHGTYTRVGNLLHLSFYWYHAGATGGTGGLKIKNLPFTSTRYGNTGWYPSLLGGYNMHSNTIFYYDYTMWWQLNAADELVYYSKEDKSTTTHSLELSGSGTIIL